MNIPYITIIMPTLRAERTLSTSLDSVLGQQFRNYELLIMDSLSGDGTLAIAAEYSTRDERIRVFSEPDEGVYDAMNKGIQKAKGEWILFLGSDDKLHDDGVLQAFASVTGLNGLDLVYGNVISPSYKGIYDGEFTFEKLLKRNMPHQAIFYRRELFQRIGRFKIRYKGYADWDLNIRCFKDNAVRVRYTEQVIAWFGADGISSRHDVPFLREVMVPEQLRLLARNPHRLRSVTAFDEWWRLLRNAALRDRTTLKEYSEQENIPRAIDRMVSCQRWIPAGLLQIGFFSKLTMFLNYIGNLLTTSL